MREIRAISLFTGAGGMDVGFQNAGITVSVANELNKYACLTYLENHPGANLLCGDIADYMDMFEKYKGIDIVFGGPPCQGFSVAGKMNPEDERSQLIWKFLDVVENTQPKVFIMENVKALATLSKWEDVRKTYLERTNAMGYYCKYIVVNAAEFGVSQNRERVFFIGCRKEYDIQSFINSLEKKKEAPLSLRELFATLPVAGDEGNEWTCTAKITPALKPVLRKSPYAGMLFNGMGRPLNLESVCSTLPASMGGNKTPIIDANLLHNPNGQDWVKEYHRALWEENAVPQFAPAPDFLRRLTITETALIQSFPRNYKFKGSNSAIYTQIGNAVPCKLAEVIAETVIEEGLLN